MSETKKTVGEQIVMANGYLADANEIIGDNPVTPLNGWTFNLRPRAVFNYPTDDTPKSGCQVLVWWNELDPCTLGPNDRMVFDIVNEDRGGLEVRVNFAGTYKHSVVLEIEGHILKWLGKKAR